MSKMKVFIIILMTVLVVISILLMAGYFVIGYYFYNIALSPTTSKAFVLGEDADEVQEQEQKGLEKVDWLSLNSNDVYITATNNGNLKLHAYEITNTQSSDVWTIVIHGYSEQGKSMTNYAQQFYNRAYNVLMVDLREHGKSEGDYIGMGWHDRLDIIDWANYLIDKNPNCKIILYGVSMGGATVMMTTGEDLPDNIRVAIEDCGYTSIWDEFDMLLKDLFNLPSFPVLNAANCKKEKLVIEGAAHAESASVNPELYWKTIDMFIEENL